MHSVEHKRYTKHSPVVVLGAIVLLSSVFFSIVATQQTQEIRSKASSNSYYPKATPTKAYSYPTPTKKPYAYTSPTSNPYAYPSPTKPYYAPTPTKTYSYPTPTKPYYAPTPTKAYSYPTPTKPYYVPTPTPTLYYAPTKTPTPYYAPTATPTPYYAPTPTKTPTPTQVQYPTATPIYSYATPSPAATIAPTYGYPTTTPAPASSLVTVKLLLHGIGNGGDNVNAGSPGNFAPLHTQRTATVDVYNATNQLVTTKQGTVTFSTVNGNFVGTINLGTEITTGLYTVKIKVDQYLRGLVPGIQTLTAGATVDLTSLSLVTGDVNNDNQINILDYNMIVGCFSDLLPPVNCPNNNALLTDITDDGVVNQYDYNLFVRELTNLGGQ